jgi:hypothetical protein
MHQRKWLLFIYQIPATPSTHRAFAWRKLKGMGVLYLQNSICMLPDGSDARSMLEALREDIVSRGGEVQLYQIQLPNAEQEHSIIERFGLQIHDEYGEFLEQCQAFHAELEKERAKHHLTFGELEENEGGLDRLRSWLPKIQGRDFFHTDIGERAINALQSCETDLASFQREVEAASSA